MNPEEEKVVGCPRLCTKWTVSHLKTNLVEEGARSIKGISPTVPLTDT